MKIKIKQFILEFWPYFLVILFIVLPWFLSPGYLFFTDNVWGPNIKLDWTSSGFLLNLLVKTLSFIFSIYFLEKIFISGVLILILLGGRFFVKTISKNIPAALIFILSLFALFNPFVYDRALYGQFGVLISYGCVFFIISYLFKTWQILEFKNLYPAAIFSAIALMFSIHFIFLLAPFYLLFFIAVFRHKKFWLAFLFSALIVLILNANWLLALKNSPTTNFIEQGITKQDLQAFATVGKNGAETFTNVLLMSGFWGKEQFRYLNLTDQPGWQRSFILLSPIIIYGLYLSFKKNKKLTLSLLGIFILSILLAVGIKSGASNGLSMFLYDHLPLYKGLREPQKWVAIIIPIYLFFLTLGSSQLSKMKIIKNNQILSGVFLVGIIIMLAPSLLWGFNRQVKPTPYPSDWAQVNNLVTSPNCSDKILFLPWHMYMSLAWTGNIIANPASAYFTCPVISGTNMEWGGIYDNSQNPEGKVVDDWIKTKEQNGAPDFRYIILAKEVDYKSYSWLSDLPYIKLLTETNTLFVYEIKP